MKENIFLVGFSATGKSNTGKALAKRLGYEFVDMDLQIEANTGRIIQQIFAEDGEESFRKLEHDVLEELCKESFQVISTGGGAVITKENRDLMVANGFTFCLEARPETIYVRLLLDQNQRANGGVRPLLQGENQFERIKALKAARQIYYSESDWTVHTDFLTPEEVAEEIERALNIVKRRGIVLNRGTNPFTKGQADAIYYTGKPGAEIVTKTEPQAGTGEELVIKTSQGSYNVFFSPGLLKTLGELIKDNLPDSAGRSVFIISDDNVGKLYGQTALKALEKGGYKSKLKIVPAGEQSKNLDQAKELLRWLASEKAERKDIVLALGGGVVGDLAGFVASSWLRSVPLVQVPTSLLAMIDSSVGGKTGVNLPEGKNLVGAFYQPRLVVADVTALNTLHARERTSGWAEVIKHAIIPGADPDETGALRRVANLENNLEKLVAGDSELTSAILRESVAVKAGVVEVDEREAGLRMTLNYGHTYAHALEAASEYNKLLHGEAVAIGMHGVALLAKRLGYCDEAFVERQKRLLVGFGLPISVKVDQDKAMAAMGLDKKSERGAIRWIIPTGIGKVEILNNIATNVVQEVLKDIIQ